MNDKRILILGGGTMQVPAINLAKGMGLSVIVADGNPDVPGRKIADFFEHVDLKDSKGMIDIALKYKSEAGLDGVFTTGTDFSETVALVARAAGLPGIPVEAARNASNKFRMREVLASSGIPVPGFFLISRDTAPLECKENRITGTGLDFPLVVKPVDNMGARGIRKVESCHEFGKAVETAASYSRTGEVIVEEYLDGPEYSLDALVYDDEISICGIADRHIYFPPYFIEMGHTIPAEGDPAVIEEVSAVFKQGIHALGISEGAAKGDIKWSGGRAYIGEIAARLSGGYMSGWTYPYSSGVEVTRSAIRIALGLPPEDLTPVLDKTTAERAFISIPGSVQEIIGRDEPFKIDGVKHVFIRVSKGDSVSFPTNNVEKCGNCIAVADTRKEAVFAAEEGCRSVVVRLAPDSEVTGRFLFGNKPEWIPDAYSLSRQENLSAAEQFGGLEVKGTEIFVPLLPNLPGERALDWHGKTMADAFKEVVKITRCRTYKQTEHPEGIVLGRIFLQAFLRGGVQGGIWIVDFYRDALEKGTSLEEPDKRWQN